jgi:hypothetical protein
VLAAPLTAIARDLYVYVYQRLGGLSPAAARQSVSAGGPAEAAVATTPG